MRSTTLAVGEAGHFPKQLMRICLIGATHPCHNPRLIREADSLADAGHEVRVVTPCIMAELEQKDQRLIAHRTWKLQQVDLRPSGLLRRYRSMAVRGRRRLGLRLFRYIKRIEVARYAYTMAMPELTALAANEQADWFIAHSQPALPVAATVARRWGARLAFDCEDLLGQLGGDRPDLVTLIERTYIPQCDYVSTPSRAIAAVLARDYAVEPLVLYNVFPLALAASLQHPVNRPMPTKLRIHWFGQTIGFGRGIEEAIEAVGILGADVAELHLRGEPANGFAAVIASLARAHNVGRSVVVHKPVDHDRLIGSLGEFDVGLAVERPDNGNTSATVSNKLFSYLLGGLAVAATSTPGQREIMDEVPAAGFLYPAGDPSALAAGLRKWIESRDQLRLAQTAAWEAARSRFCWDMEKGAFFKALQLI